MLDWKVACSSGRCKTSGYQKTMRSSAGLTKLMATLSVSEYLLLLLNTTDILHQLCWEIIIDDNGNLPQIGTSKVSGDENTG